VKLVAVGAGQGLLLGHRGDADMLLVHDPGGEQWFVGEGFGIRRPGIAGVPKPGPTGQW
jgi:tungstate transport system substrate-binding protein